MMLNNAKVAMREFIRNFLCGKIDEKFAFFGSSFLWFWWQTVDFTVPVIDNFGDLGFALSLAIELLERKKDLKIRFFSENYELFLDMLDGQIPKNLEYLELKDWSTSTHSPIRCNFFGEKIREEDLIGQKYPTKILNFDYLQFHKDGGMGNPGVGSLHGTSYTIAETEVIHIVPSLLPEGGGVVIPKEHHPLSRSEFLKYIGETSDLIDRHWCSIFVYSDTLLSMKEVFKKYPEWVFFVCGVDGKIEMKNVVTLPFLPLGIYGAFLKHCDANIVRGENSLVSALLAGKPFLWDIYKENNGAHLGKMEDFGEYVDGVIPGFGEILGWFMKPNNRWASINRLLKEDGRNFKVLKEQIIKNNLVNIVINLYKN